MSKGASLVILRCSKVCKGFFETVAHVKLSMQVSHMSNKYPDFENVIEVLSLFLIICRILGIFDKKQIMLFCMSERSSECVESGRNNAMQILKNVFQMRLSIVFDVKKSNPDFEVLDFPGNRPKFFAGKKKIQTRSVTNDLNRDAGAARQGLDRDG